jgi:hypothetical protein
MLRTDTIAAAESFRPSQGQAPHWAGSGNYRYVVPYHLAERATLLLQIRVRRWAHDSTTLSELKVDAARVRRQVKVLEGFL